MKTLQQIAIDHLNELRKNEFLVDIEDIRKLGNTAAYRIKNRITNDPAIVDIAEFFAKAVKAGMMLPSGFSDQAVRNAILNCIIEWEDINNEFNNQLRP